MTYLPRHFEETHPATLHALVRDYPLATWVVQSEGELLVNHIPFLLDTTRGEHGTLIGHVARSNPVWRTLQAERASVAIFTGANTYISPNWYPTKKENGKAVPTWNYAIVHAHGVAQVVDDSARVLDIVSRLSDVHEAAQPQPWKVTDAPADYIDKLLRGIVGIEIPIQRWIGKWKTSQNQPPENQHGVAQGLRQQGSDAARKMADWVMPEPPATSGSCESAVSRLTP